METKVSPNSIQDRAEALTAASDKETADKVAAEKATADAAAKVEADKAAAEAAKKIDLSSNNTDPSKKSEVIEPKIPNDPSELRKWNTKVSQENAALREEIRGLKTSVEKMLKKPVDYKELAKNPEALQKQIEAERAEAAAEVEERLQIETTRAIKNETIIARMECEQDKTNYPEWQRVFPLIQNLSANVDGRINFNKPPKEVVHDLYTLAVQLAPKADVAPVVPEVKPKADPVPVAKTYTEAELEAARKEAFDKAQQAFRDEQNGAGIGSAGKGGRRSSGVSKEALQEMPLKDLKALISKE